MPHIFYFDNGSYWNDIKPNTNAVLKQPATNDIYRQ